MSLYTFLSRFVLAKTNLPIALLYVYSPTFSPAKLNHSFKPQQWISVTLALANGYIAHSLWHCCRGAYLNLILYHLLLPPHTLSLSPSFTVQLKTSYWHLRPIIDSPQPVCLCHIQEVSGSTSTIHTGFHHPFLKFWTILFSSQSVHAHKNLPSYFTCPSSHSPLKLSSAVTP